jgi:hypothetical protein
MISYHIYLSVTLAHKESQMQAARQAARHSPAKPPWRAQCPGIIRHQISIAQAICPRQVRQPWPAPPPAVLISSRRQLEKSVSWSGRERLRCLWYRLRLTVAEMSYATRRTVELQAPWISDNRASRLRNELR